MVANPTGGSFWERGAGKGYYSRHGGLSGKPSDRKQKPKKLGSRWLLNAKEMSINNMESTWPTQEFCIGDPTRPIFHLCALGVCVGGNANFSVRVGGYANFSVFRYQHVGIPNAKLLCWGNCPTRRPNTSVFRVTSEYRLKNFFFFQLGLRCTEIAPELLENIPGCIFGWQ